MQGEIALAQTEAEFAELRRELQETGYIRRSGKEKKGREKPIAPREFRSSSGLRILVGRSNVQNDALTRKADKRDLWLHTQKIHGSHVILCTEDGAFDDEPARGRAARGVLLAGAGRQQCARGLHERQIRQKPAGARPGMVVYETYRTLYVTPDEETIRRLDRKSKKEKRADALFFLLMRVMRRVALDRLRFAKKHRDAPYAGKAHERVDHAADRAI